MEIFEKASRLKLIFNNPRGGTLAVQDLWDLPLTSSTGRPNLDSLAIDLHRQLKATEGTVSFVDDTKETDTTLQLSFDIVKHIIGVRKTERDAANKEKERKETKQKVLEIIARKKSESLEGKPLEELEAMVASL